MFVSGNNYDYATKQLNTNYDLFIATSTSPIGKSFSILTDPYAFKPNIDAPFDDAGMFQSGEGHGFRSSSCTMGYDAPIHASDKANQVNGLAVSSSALDNAVGGQHVPIIDSSADIEKNIVISAKDMVVDNVIEVFIMYHGYGRRTGFEVHFMSFDTNPH